MLRFLLLLVLHLQKVRIFQGITRLLFSTKKGCSFVRRVKFSSFLWLRRDFWTHVERH